MNPHQCNKKCMSFEENEDYVGPSKLVEMKVKALVVVMSNNEMRI